MTGTGRLRATDRWGLAGLEFQSGFLLVEAAPWFQASPEKPHVADYTSRRRPSHHVR
jgi:hypothetical protein